MLRRFSGARTPMERPLRMLSDWRRRAMRREGLRACDRTSIARLPMAALLALAILARPASAASPAGTSFTYQGQIKLNGSPVNGTCAFRFRLFDDPLSGAQYGLNDDVSVSVANGLFSTP